MGSIKTRSAEELWVSRLKTAALCKFTVFPNPASGFYTRTGRYFYTAKASLIINYLYNRTCLQPQKPVYALRQLFLVMAYKYQCSAKLAAIPADQVFYLLNMVLVQALAGLIQHEQGWPLNHSAAQEQHSLDACGKAGERPVLIFVQVQKTQPFQNQLMLFSGQPSKQTDGIPESRSQGMVSGGAAVKEQMQFRRKESGFLLDFPNAFSRSPLPVEQINFIGVGLGVVAGNQA